MEATGHYWLALYTHLRKEGFTIRVINAIQSDALRAMYIRQQKNDSRDSFIIADVIRFGRFCETTVSPPDLFALRELCRHRFYIVDSVSDIKRKVIALLDQIFPEYENLFTDTFGKASLELLSEYTTPEEILNVDADKLVEIINIASHERFGLKKASEIQDAARNSFGILLATDTIALLIRQYIEQIRFVEKQIDALDAEIARLLSTFETQLTTITGVGPTLAAVILSEIGDVKRFSSAAKLAAFAGVDPTMKQSGDFTGSRNRMSKRGSPYLRRALWLAATVASFKDPSISSFYQRKRAEGKSHMTTLGHVVRKMVSIIFAVLRDNSPYSPAISI
jgi:transposase